MHPIDQNTLPTTTPNRATLGRRGLYAVCTGFAMDNESDDLCLVTLDGTFGNLRSL